jgi:hypothetical protein
LARPYNPSTTWNSIIILKTKCVAPPRVRKPRIYFLKETLVKYKYVLLAVSKPANEARGSGGEGRAAFGFAFDVDELESQDMAV